MKVHGDYEVDGYAFLEGLVPPEVAKALLDEFWRELRDEKIAASFNRNALLTRPAMELHGASSAAISAFLWGLTPSVSELTERDLLPSYAYFRLYQQGDRLRVHGDRAGCEHSLSLTLGYSDDQVWPFEVGHEENRAHGRHA